MNQLLNQDLFLIKEHIGIFKAANNFDVFNPETSELMMQCREEKLSFFTKMFRFTKFKIMTPFHVEIKSNTGDDLLSLKRGATFLGFTPVEVFDENGKLVGKLNRKFRIGGAKIEMFDSNEQLICTLKGNLVGWEFTISREGQEWATISKKWAGIGKEFFTSADNYVLSIKDYVQKDDPARMLILSAVLSIDFLLKEN